jgi:capsular exopolysaccharide synthesis family protein
MRLLEYLRILRQRWWVLPITALVGFSLAFLTQPAEPSAPVASTQQASSLYRATHTLISEPIASRKNREIDWDRIALLATSGDVPTMVARQMRLGRRRSVEPLVPVVTKHSRARKKGGPRAVALSYVKVTAQPDGATGSITITAEARSPTTATKIANTFASELLVFLNTNGKARYDAELAQLNSQRNAQIQAMATFDYLRPGVSNPYAILTAEAQRAELQTRLEEINEDINTTASFGPDNSGLRSLEPANSWTATQVSGPSAQTPILSSVESGPSRLLMGGAIGLLIGIAGLLLFEVLSARLRDVSAVEGATRLPVIAEIPEVKLGRAEWFQVLAAEEPAGLTAEAHRSLRTSMLAMWQRHPTNTPANSLVGPGAVATTAPPLRTLLVTSSSPAEGKSVTAVNLAAAFAEIGATVIVLDADFRRPQLDRYFARPTTPNLGDLDPDLTTEDLESVLQESGIPGVRFAASAPPKSAPATAMAIAKAATAAAPELCDIVILDSPPLLLANDAADLATIVDGVVVMVRSGWTRRGAVVRATDLLRRLESTVIGTVLVGVQHGKRDGYYGYYGYYGYGYGYGRGESVEDSLRHRLMPWRRPRPQPESTTEPEVGVSVGDPVAPETGTDAPTGRPDEEPWV